MHVSEKELLGQLLRSRGSAIADQWHRALAPTGFVSIGTHEVQARLVAFVHRAIELLLAELFDEREAQALGAAVAELYYSHPDSLSRTQNVLALELILGLPPEQRLELQPRLTAVISEMAAGFLIQSRQTLLSEQESIRQALDASEARFRTVFDRAAVGMGIGDVQGRILDVNPALQAMFGYSAEEMRRMGVDQLTHPDDTASVWELYRALIEGQHDHFRTEKRYYRKDGGTIWCNLAVSLIRDAEGRPQFQIAMMENITARKQAEGALQRSEARFRSLIQNALDIITILNGDGTVRYASPAIERVLGHQPEELVGSRAINLVHPDDRSLVGSAFLAVLDNPTLTPTVEFRYRHRNRSWRWIQASATHLLDDPAVGGIVFNARDISERKEIEERLWHQAYHDPLTGLPNRTRFTERLERALGEGRPGSVAVFFLDLDGFKVINDSLGHEYGDRLLVAVAARLASRINAGNLLARFGGDEFTILEEQITDASEVTRIAERLLAALAVPFTLNEHTLVCTASLGVVLSSSELSTPTDMMRAADVALYRAKASGKGGIALFDARRDASALVQLGRETALRHALERGELRLHYQPQVDLATGCVVGVEALVRWQHPKHGLLMPKEFIPLAEDTGLVVPLGEWVLGEACRQVAAWDEEFADAEKLLLFVNISPLQVRQPDLVGQIKRVLRGTGLGRGRLVLEITEQGLIENTEATDRTVEALRAFGAQLAIDDFGAYQAGLGYLRHWPIDMLKLDRALVAELGRDERCWALVAAVAGLAQTLGMVVIGEGIETAEQLEQLRTLGCNWGQGYFFTPALPPDEFVAFLRKRPALLP